MADAGNNLHFDCAFARIDVHLVMTQQLLRIFGFFLIAIVFAGCGDSKPLPPVEILNARFGLFTKSPDGKTSFTDTTTIPFEVGEGYGWIIHLRTNKPSIKVNETIKLAGPSKWGISEKPGVVSVISPDKTSLSVDQTKSGNLDWIHGAWRITEEDPPGAASISVTIEGVVQRFDFTLAR